MEVIIPMFVNTHLFWIVPKKNLLLRASFNRLLHSKRLEKIKNHKEVKIKTMVAVNVGDVWARAILEDIVRPYDEIKYLCFLPDHGVIQSVSYIFHLPEELKKCPHLAKQASLHSVVNLTTDFILKDGRYELQLKETLSDIPGVRKAALSLLEEADKLVFSVREEDEFNIYGDIVCTYKTGVTTSLTKHLVQNDLIRVDKEMFKTIEPSRDKFKESYFSYTPNWEQPLDLVEKKKLSSIIFNQDTSISMGFFDREMILNELCN